MKNKKAKTDYIILSVATIFVTVFAIISLSYAWYVTTQTGQVSTVTMSSAGVSGIQLSGDGYHWGSELDAEGGDITLNENVVFESISTSGEVVDGELLFYNMEKTSSTTIRTNLINDELSFHTFDFYIRNDESVVKELTMGYDSSITDVNFKDIAYSTRVGFINLGSASTQAGAVSLNGIGVNTLDYVWEPYSTVRNNRTALYHDTFLKEGKILYNGVNTEVVDQILVNGALQEDDLTPENEVLAVTTYDPIYSGEQAKITLIDSEAITKIRVYIWVEGQDIDCTNSISGGVADLDLSFNSYESTLDQGVYVPAEKFSTPTITNPSDMNFSWGQVETQLFENPSTETYNYSVGYIFKISKDIDGTILPIRIVKIDSYDVSVSLDLRTLDLLEQGTYFASVRVYSLDYGDSDYSNTISFEVLGTPTDVNIDGSNIATWTAVPNAASYIIKAYDSINEETYTVSTVILSNNLPTIMFNGPSGLTLLPTGRTYQISVRSIGGSGYLSCDYIDTITWSN